MDFRHPDNPVAISLEAACGVIDSNATRWIAQPKLDGWRRLAYHQPSGWEFFSKANGTGEGRPMPDELLVSLCRIPWPDGIALDMEWLGPRVAGSQHSLHVFDVLYVDGLWQGGHGFQERHAALRRAWAEATCGSTPGPVALVQASPVRDSGHLRELFEVQRSNDTSEGLVLRAAESGLIGARPPNRPSDNSLWLKVKFR